MSMCFSLSPARRLSEGVRKGHLSIAVVRVCNASECVLVSLPRVLNNGHEQEEPEEEPQLGLLAVDGVHAVQGQGPAEALVAHVERVAEAEVLKGHPIAN